MRLWLSGPRLPVGGMRLGMSAPIRPDIRKPFWQGVAHWALDGVIVIAVLAILAGAFVLFELFARIIPAQITG